MWEQSVFIWLSSYFNAEWCHFPFNDVTSFPWHTSWMLYGPLYEMSLISCSRAFHSFPQGPRVFINALDLKKFLRVVFFNLTCRSLQEKCLSTSSHISYANQTSFQHAFFCEVIFQNIYKIQKLCMCVVHFMVCIWFIPLLICAAC